jgi:hypothetical protein
VKIICSDFFMKFARMRHAHHQFLDAAAGGSGQQGFQERDQRLATFERKPLLADIPGVQKAFERLGRQQMAVNFALLGPAGRRQFPPGLKPFTHPVAHPGGFDVHELGADAPGISRLQRRDHLAQTHGLAAHEITRGHRSLVKSGSRCASV